MVNGFLVPARQRGNAGFGQTVGIEIMPVGPIFNPGCQVRNLAWKDFKKEQD
jgi:hypothetical protein